eukprot:SAG31_NODE_437_length_15714_cov_8.527344_12_plen_459_part_00
MSSVLVVGAGSAASSGPGSQLNAGRLVVELLAAADGPGLLVVSCRTAAAAAELSALSHRINAVVADCTREADCARLIEAATAEGRCLTHVLSTLGGVESSSVGQSNLIKACPPSLERFTLMTSLGCGETWEHLAPAAQKFLRDELKAKDVAEEALMSSGLEYCIVRPGGLLPGSESATGGGVLVASDPTVSGSINRADLAVLTLQCMMSPSLQNVVCSAVDVAKARGDTVSTDHIVSEPYDVSTAANVVAADGPSSGKTGNHDTDSTERPSFELLSQEDGFQIRKYPSLIVAETAMRPRSSDEERDSTPFMTLAGFIGVLSTPANHAPGTEEPVPIAMTAPVLSPGDSTKMSFIMPSKFTMENMPVPNDSTVTVSEVPPTVYAVATFSGWAREQEMQKRAAALLDTLEEKGLTLKRDAAGKPVWLQARYDSPWVPAEKRTNEVLVELEHASLAASANL